MYSKLQQHRVACAQPVTDKIALFALQYCDESLFAGAV
jgi:hypothetical protein